VEDEFFVLERRVPELVPFGEDEDGAGVATGFVGVFVDYRMSVVMLDVGKWEVYLLLDHLA